MGSNSDHILVVDDQPSICRMIHDMLTGKGYSVSTANSYGQADDLLTERDFGVVISDICFEQDDQDGITLLERTRAVHPDTPVILITGVPSVHTASMAVKLNAFEYISKPVSLHKLAESVSNALKYRALQAEKRQNEKNSQKYRQDLEELVALRTASLVQSNQRYQLLYEFLVNVIESLAHPFMVIDVADFSIKIANSAAKGNCSNERMTCHELNHGYEKPCSIDTHRCVVREVVATRRPVTLKHFHIYDSGRETEYEVHAFPLFDGDGKVVQVIKYAMDITEKKRLEAVAEAANLMDNLGYIFSGIRHEIGNPINSVKLALSVLSMNLESYPRPKIREFVDRAQAEILRVEYLLKALKNFSMFESPQVEPVHMHGFMNNFMALVQQDFTDKGVRIRLSVADEQIYAMTDHRAFHQVMLNLMTNAADAFEDHVNAQIMVEVKRSSSELVQVKVSDNGRGMSASERQNLFRPFYTSKPHGTGLGLVIIKKMLAKMDSTIRIESNSGWGTTVLMFLPAGKAVHE